jgi:GAF domain-containing protein
MYKDIKKQIEHLEEKKTHLNAEFDATENRSLLDFYIKIMPKMLDAERCSIFIYDPDSMTIWLKGGTQVEERDIEVTGEYDSVVGDVITTGKYRIVDRLDEKSGIHKEMDEKTGFTTRNILCIPIRSLDGKKVMGAVQILNKKDGSAFNNEDRILLEEMAHYLQLTIENIFYNQESTVVLDDLYTMMKKITFISIGVIVLLVILIAVF